MVDFWDTPIGFIINPGYKIGKSIGQSIGNTIVDGVSDAAESLDSRKENETSFRNATDKWKLLINLGGGIAGAIGGWKLGSNFGTVGKVVGGVGLCLVGSKLGKIVQEVGTDVAAAQDYAREAEEKSGKGNFGKALWNNLCNWDGQSYDGAKGSEITVDSEPEL